jgi:hypothetical protein
MPSGSCKPGLIGGAVVSPVITLLLSLGAIYGRIFVELLNEPANAWKTSLAEQANRPNLPGRVCIPRARGELSHLSPGSRTVCVRQCQSSGTDR